MRTDKIKKNLIILATLILFVCPPAHAGHFFSVPRVVDGDTIIVNIFGKKESVRLIGVDTPETKHPRKPIERYGKKASAFTKKLCEGKRVRLEYESQ